MACCDDEALMPHARGSVVAVAGPFGATTAWFYDPTAGWVVRWEVIPYHRFGFVVMLAFDSLPDLLPHLQELFIQDQGLFHLTGERSLKKRLRFERPDDVHGLIFVSDGAPGKNARYFVTLIGFHILLGFAIKEHQKKSAKESDCGSFLDRTRTWIQWIHRCFQSGPTEWYAP